VVEDSPTQRELIIDLKGSGLKVMVATNGMEALEQVSFCSDLVVLDCHAQMNYEVCRRLRLIQRPTSGNVFFKGEELIATGA